MIANRIRMRKKSKGDTWDNTFFEDPEVGRVLHTNGLNISSIEELATITSFNPYGWSGGSYFDTNRVITKFPELQYCTGLSDLYAAFTRCSNLREVGDIPNSVTDMSETFDGCTNLDGIFILKPINPPYYSNTFRDVNVVAIYVPNESVDIYKTASGWSEHADKIRPISSSEDSGGGTLPGGEDW